MSPDQTLSDLRIEREFTQERLAGESGVAVETIGKIERGETKNPRPAIVEALRIVLKVEKKILLSAISCSHAKKKYTSNNSEKDKYYDQYKFCESVFNKLSFTNAKCDIEIFHALFLDYIPKKMSQREIDARVIAVSSCMKTVRSNIIDVLDSIVGLFEAMMEEKCSACLQVLVKSPKFLSAKTVERDHISATNRHIGRQRPIVGNTISERIFLEGEKIIIINDVSAEIKSGFIKTTSTSAGKDYNSVFIVAIPDVRPSSEISVHSTLATLCVDSRQPFKESRVSVCTHFAQELAFRLGAMNYRLDNLAFHYSELQKLRGVR